jgi:hypothetical protein
MPVLSRCMPLPQSHVVVLISTCNVRSQLVARVERDAHDSAGHRAHRQGRRIGAHNKESAGDNQRRWLRTKTKSRIQTPPNRSNEATEAELQLHATEDNPDGCSANKQRLAQASAEYLVPGLSASAHTLLPAITYSITPKVRF